MINLVISAQPVACRHMSTQDLASYALFIQPQEKRLNIKLPIQYTCAAGLTIVTRLPNHWWASSCDTTSATHWRVWADELDSSMSKAVSLQKANGHYRPSTTTDSGSALHVCKNFQHFYSDAGCR